MKGGLQFSKFLKNTICIGLCKLKCTEKRLIPFSPLHFLPEFVPHTEFKGRPEGTKWNALYHTALRNYAAISLQAWCRVSFLKGGLQFSKFLKNTICIGLCKLKCTEKRLIPFSPLHFLPEFVPHTEFKGRPEGTKWNALYHTALRNYAAISLQVPSILSLLSGYSSQRVSVLR